MCVSRYSDISMCIFKNDEKKFETREIELEFRYEVFVSSVSILFELYIFE